MAAFATRFAAKEALFKLLTSGNPWTSWKEVEVRRLDSVRYTVSLHGAAAEQATRQGITTITLSLSQDAGTAVAVAVADVERER